MKDRIAVKMVEAAEREGKLKPGGTIVEPTSGNTGVGLAIVAQARGYSCVFVCPDKVSEDKRNVLAAYGARVVVCPTAVEPEHPDSYYSVSDRLTREIEGAWKPDQYSNPNNPASHYETTGPEIWAADRGPGHPLRGRHRHRGHDQRRRPLPQGGLRGARCRSSAPTRRARSTPAAPAGPTWWRAWGRTSGRHLRQDDLRPGDRGLRRGLVRDDPAAGPGGGAAGRRLLRDGRGSRGSAGPRDRRPRRCRRRAAARLGPRLPGQDLQRHLAEPLRLRPPARRPAGGG